MMSVSVDIRLMPKPPERVVCRNSLVALRIEIGNLRASVFLRCFARDPAVSPLHLSLGPVLDNVEHYRKLREYDDLVAVSNERRQQRPVEQEQVVADLPQLH